MKDSFFSKKNYIGILIGIGLLIVGFYSLSRPPVDGVWTLSVAPIVLCLTYCVVFPIAIIWNKEKEKTNRETGA